MIFNEATWTLVGETEMEDMEVDVSLRNNHLHIAIQTTSGKFPNLHRNKIILSQHDVEISDITLLDHLCSKLEEARQKLMLELSNETKQKVEG